MTHVLMISQYFPPDINGSSTRSYNVAKGLVSQGCKVTVITTFPHYPRRDTSGKYKNKILLVEEEDGIRLVRIWIPKFSHSSNYKRTLLHLSFCFSVIIGLFYVRKIDVILAMNPSFLVAFPAIFCKIIFGKQIIRNVDDLWPEVLYDLGIVKSKAIKKILDYFSGISYKVSAAIIPIGQGYVDTLISKYHIPREKIIVIEHSVDIKKFPKTTLNNVRSKDKKKTIMYSGAINVGYDFEPVIKAAKILEMSPVHFIIRGTGELMDYLKNLIEVNKVKNVQVNTELLEKNELINFLTTADIFLVPMNSGVIDLGLPTKILEFQALGKPIICISNGEAGNYIEKTKSGLVVKNKDPEDLATSIIRLVEDEQLAKQLGDNGSQYIRENLTIEKIGARLMKVIKCHT